MKLSDAWSRLRATARNLRLRGPGSGRPGIAAWAALGAALASPVASVWAATQGTTGPTSTGSVEISYVQNLNARITGFADLALGVWSGSGDLSGNDNLCVGRTGTALFGTGTYRIRASGDGDPFDPAAFTLSNGTNTIRYLTYFNDQAGTANRQPLVPGLTLTGQTSFGLWLFFNIVFGCAVENANISVVVPEAELQTGAGNYAGTLALMLMPE